MKVAKAAQAAGKNVQLGKKIFLLQHQRPNHFLPGLPRDLPRALSLGLAHVRGVAVVRISKVLKCSRRQDSWLSCAGPAGPKIRTLDQEVGLESGLKCGQLCPGAVSASRPGSSTLRKGAGGQFQSDPSSGFQFNVP